MNYAEVKKLLDKHVRTEEEFNAFIFGQTVGVINGEIDYYECDVERFFGIELRKNDTITTWSRNEAGSNDTKHSEERLIKAVTYCVDCCKALEFEMGPWLNGALMNLDIHETFYRRLGTILDGFPSVVEEANKQANELVEG